MAATKYLDYDGLLYFWSLIKARLALKADAQSVTAGSYGPSTDASPAHSGTFKVPYVQVTSQGVVTAISEKTITLPASGNTDTKVKQNLKATSDTGKYPVLLKGTTTANDNVANESNYVAAVTVQPSTGTVKATKFEGAVTGNADSSTEFASAQTVELTGDVTGSASSKAGWSVATTLANSGVSAGSYGPSSNATPAYGATFNVPYITVDSKGRVTAASTKTVKIPASDNVDIKVNVTLDTTHKAYLLGVTTAPTSTAQALESVSDTGVYLDTTAGKLTATSFAGNGQNITLNTASRAVVTDSNKKLAVSSVTATELGYVSGVTSAIQTQLNSKAASATTLAGYGITDAYTKSEIDTKLTSAMHYKGSKNTYADLPATGNTVGDFYNITQTGENYAWTGDTWDVTGSIVDLQSITNAEIDTVVAS